VGASKLTPGNDGYWTAYSVDNGASWFGPYRIGALPGGTSRLVWSASGFHAFIQDTTNSLSIVLTHWSSSDGMSWTRQADVSTFTLPLASSPSSVACSGSTCGEIYYAPTPDAVGSSGLGWVIAYPVNISGKNGINVSTELGGGVTITYTTDLFSHGITASSSGDWHLSYQTHQGGDRVLPLQEGVVYRVSGTPASYLGATIYMNIEPSGWFYLSTPGRCIDATASSPCFASGDYFRPASNTFTGASIPFIRSSATNFTDLVQAFIQDPQTGNVPQFLPHVEPYVQGTDLKPRGVITPAHVREISAQRGRPVVSTMIGEAMRRAGLLP
jgi:hypothetical protein